MRVWERRRSEGKKRIWKAETKFSVSESVYNIEYLVQRFEKIRTQMNRTEIAPPTPTDFAKHADRSSDYQIKD